VVVGSWHGTQHRCHPATEGLTYTSTEGLTYTYSRPRGLDTPP
jgi:hypothetical protein